MSSLGWIWGWDEVVAGHAVGGGVEAIDYGVDDDPRRWAVMVALVLYAFSIGERSARATEPDARNPIRGDLDRQQPVDQNPSGCIWNPSNDTRGYTTRLSKVAVDREQSIVATMKLRRP